MDHIETLLQQWIEAKAHERAAIEQRRSTEELLIQAGIKNGQLIDLESTQTLSRAAVSEAMAVARAQGIKIRDDAPEHVLDIAKNTALNRSSMGQDVDNKRQTEIDAINGVVVREGKRLGVDTPVNQTLTALVETLQAHYV